MKINSRGLSLIQRYEGFSRVAYLCPAKVWTIGFGTTKYPNGSKVKEGDQATEAKALEYLTHDVAFFERSVLRLLGSVKLNENQFSALVSFAYNLGAGALSGSTLLKKVLKNPHDPTIQAEFMRWNRAGGRVLTGLTNRRRDEASLYFTKA